MFFSGKSITGVIIIAGSARKRLFTRSAGLRYAPTERPLTCTVEEGPADLSEYCASRSWATSRPVFVPASHADGTSSPLAWKGFPCQKISLKGGDVGYLFFSIADDGTKKLPGTPRNSGCAKM